MGSRAGRTVVCAIDLAGFEGDDAHTACTIRAAQVLPVACLCAVRMPPVFFCAPSVWRFFGGGRLVGRLWGGRALTVRGA